MLRKRSIVWTVRRIPCHHVIRTLYPVLQPVCYTYPWRVCSNLGSLGIGAGREQLIEALDIQVVSTGQATARCELKCKFGVIQGVDNIWNNRIFLQRYRQDLTLLVDTDDTGCCFMFGSDENSFATDTVHVDASCCFQVVKMDEAHLGDHVNDAKSFADLHSYREITSCFGREKDLDCLLLEGWVAFLMVNFNNLKLMQFFFELGNSAVSQKIRYTFLPWLRPSLSGQQM